MSKKNKRVDLDVRPHPSPFYSNYDYVDESKYQKENGTKGPGGGLYHGNMDKYKSVKEFIETDRKRRRKQRKKALWSIIKNEKISST